MQAPERLETYGHPIILIGLMGCGKTTVGKALSVLTGMPLLDTDAIIEEHSGRSIADIFQSFGEAHFRSMETALLRYLKQHPTPAIISTGGGIVVRAENRKLLHRLGFTVWLDVEVPALLARLARSTTRPLLNRPDRQEVLERLEAERRPLYAETANLALPSTHLDIHGAADCVYAAAKDFFALRS